MKKILILFVTLYISNTLFSYPVSIKKFYSEDKKRIYLKLPHKKKLKIEIKKVILNNENISAFFLNNDFTENCKTIKSDIIYARENKFTIKLNNIEKGLYYIKIYDKLFTKYYKILISDSRIVAKKDKENIFLSFINSKTGAPYSKYYILYLYNNTIIKTKNVTTKLFTDFKNNHVVVAYKSNSIDYIKVDIKNRENNKNNIIEIIPKKNDFYIGEVLEFSVILRLRNDTKILLPDISSISISILNKYNQKIVQKKVKNIVNGIYEASFKIDDKYKEGKYYIVVKWNNYTKKYPIKIYKKRDNKYLFYFSGVKNTYFNNETIKIKITILNKFGALLNGGKLRCNILAKKFSDRNYKYYKTILTEVDDGEAYIKFKPKFLKHNNYKLKLIFKVRSNNGYIEGDYKLLNVLNSSYSLDVIAKKNIYELNKKIFFKYKIKKFYNGNIKKFFVQIYKINDIEHKYNTEFYLQRELSGNLFSGKVVFNINKTGYYKAVFILIDNRGTSIKKEKYFWIISYIYGVNIKKDVHKIFIDTDKTTYSFSDIGKAIIILPKKNMWVNIALERNNIYTEKYIFSEKKFLLFDFPINEKYSPNVFLTVTGLKNNKFYYQSKKIKVPMISKFIKLKTTISNTEAFPEGQNLIKVKALNYWNHNVNVDIMTTTMNNGFYNFYSITMPDLIKKWYSNLKNNILCLNNFTHSKKHQKKIKKAKNDDFIYSKYLLNSTLNYKFTHIGRKDIYNYRFKYNEIVGYWRTLFLAINEDSKYGVKSVISKVKKDIELDYYFPRWCYVGDTFYFTIFGKNYSPIRQKLKVNYFVVNGKYGSSLQKDIYLLPKKYNTLYIRTVPKVDKTMKIGITIFFPEKIERRFFFMDINRPEIIKEKNNEDISIRKKYYYLKYKEYNNKYYSKISSTGNEFDYGDDILTEIRIRSERKYYNLKLVDFIPAGCEIIQDTTKYHLTNINPNINYGKYIKSKKIIFKLPILEKGEYYIYYIMKSKFKGIFTVPPLMIKYNRKVIYSNGEIRRINIE